MKRLINIFTIGIVLAFTSCVNDEIWSSLEEPQYSVGSGSGIQIIGAVEDYEDKDVSTRAEEEVADSHITEMTMFIFLSDGTLLQGYDAGQNPISSAINIQKPNPTFLIETSRYNGTGILASMDGDQSMMKYYDNKATDLSECSIYIVANAWDQLTAKGLVDGIEDGNDDTLDEITSLDDLNAVLLDVDNTLDMPKKKDENGNYTDDLGFPMIGTHDSDITFNLGYNSGQSNSGVATIPLKKLYSKVRFRIQVNSKQIVEGSGITPKFTIDTVKVFNVPKQVRMGYSGGDYTSDYQFTDEPFVITDGFNNNKKTIYHSSSATTDDVIEFGFYMPEHKMTPVSDYVYPDGISNNAKQYYKPELVPEKKTPTFVRIKGSYNDHNGQIHRVEYDIYLGQNETNDFEVKRNQQLNNHIIITGVTNHKDAYSDDPDAAGNISIDHRVSVSEKGYNLYMEREAILDAHFEVRPVDIELQSNGSMRIVIPDDCNWIAMEADAIATVNKGSVENKYNGLYIPGNYNSTSVSRKGMRKFFTTSLVSDLAGNPYTYTSNDGKTEALSGKNVYFDYQKDGNNTVYYRIWFYIDENPNVYDKTGSDKQSTETGDYTVSTTQYRTAPVKFYLDTGSGEKLVATITFQQWNLWRVWNQDGTRYYDIEHEEEYLNNYASDETYDQVYSGMKWGLEDVVLSDNMKSFYLETNFSAISNALMEESKPYYDFYITESEANGTSNYRPYAGRDFSNDIMSKLLYETIYNANNEVLTKADFLSSGQLNDESKGAVEYCYRKNKTVNTDGDIITKNETDGTYDFSNVKWYTPSIDEIQEIAVAAYDEFDGVFQGNYYWSSQPAYDRYNYNYNAQIGLVDRVSGVFYQDDISNARATRSIYDPAIGWTYAPSGSDSKIGSNTVGTHTWTSILGWVHHSYRANNSYSQDNLDEGNNPRSKENRVRAVYRSGTGTRK